MAALLVIAGAAAAARAESRPRYGQTVVGSLLGAPDSLDPIEARHHADLTLVNLLYDTLYKAPAGKAVPHLALAPPELSADRRRAVIRVRPGVVFHDGRALTAADVAASLERARRAGAVVLAPVARSRATGPDTVTLELRRPVDELALLLAAPSTAVTPGGRAPGSAAVGSGPFRLRQLDRRRSEVALEAFEQHFAGRPYVQSLRLRWFSGAGAEARAYETGDAHLSLGGAVAFAGHQPKYRTELAESPATLLVYVGFGSRQRAITGHRAFRRALSAAIGRDGLRHLGAGEEVVPALTPAARALGGPRPAPRLLRARTREARAALSEAARSVPALREPARVSLRILVADSRPDDRDVAGKVAAALFRLGISAQIVEVAGTDLRARANAGEGDLFIGHLAAPVADPALQIAAAFAAAGDGWAAERLARGPLDVAAAATAISERVPLVPLFHRSVRAHHRANLRGVVPGATARIGFADLFFFGDP